MGVGWTWSALVGAMLVVARCDDEPTPSSGPVAVPVVNKGRDASGDDGSEGCVLDGYACGDAGECCSGACSEGICGLGGTCLPPGAACMMPDECCTRLCVEGGCADPPEGGAGDGS